MTPTCRPRAPRKSFRAKRARTRTTEAARTFVHRLHACESGGRARNRYVQLRPPKLDGSQALRPLGLVTGTGTPPGARKRRFGAALLEATGKLLGTAGVTLGAKPGSAIGMAGSRGALGCRGAAVSSIALATTGEGS